MEAKYFSANEAHWNAATPLHLGPGEVYDVEGFRQGKSALLPLELEEVGDVRGKSLLHAQCHFGMDTLSWARLGARCTGVDFSGEAIAAARGLNEELGLDSQFICCNLYDLDQHVSEKFDIVYTSYGVLCWLPDLTQWAQLLADRLKPGGVFHLIEFHPFRYSFNFGAPFDGTLQKPYFSTGEVAHYPADDDGVDYHATEAPLRQESYEWHYTLGEIVTAIASSGLKIEHLREHEVTAFRTFPDMVKGPDGLFRFKEGTSPIPLVFSLKAMK
jgi:SAM-dependent methyltransferase